MHIIIYDFGTSSVKTCLFEIGSEIRRVYLDYYVAGILELYFQWYRHDHSLTLDDIRDYALGIINTDMEYFLPAFRLKGERA